MPLAQRQTPHAMLPRPLHDEDARQDFVLSFRQHLAQNVNPGSAVAYDVRVRPAFEKAHGRAPADQHEVRKVMTADPYYQMWSAMQRTSQEMMWTAAIDSVERVLPDLIAQAGAPQRLGSLTLDPTLALPRYHTAYDIHLQPGGYHTDYADGDVAEGAVYDLGVPMYAMGMMGPENNASGDTTVHYFKTRFPGRTPGRVLDMGCTIGNSTVPWAKAFPSAEVYGIDVGAPCLRYAHARANAMGVAVHFAQQNAEATTFPDNHFDVVASALLFHETSRSTLPRIIAECHRILKPGGVMVHFDAWRANPPTDPLREFLGQWEVYNNNENFLGEMLQMDVRGICTAAGFAPDAVRIDQTPYVTDIHVAAADSRGYMGGFFEVPVLTAVKAG
jgi:SAM-dependent methyltransferase